MRAFDSPQVAVRNRAPDVVMPDFAYTATRVYPAVRTDLLARLPNGLGRVLDVGCGAGDFGARLVSLGMADEVCGIDISADAVDSARALLSEADVVDLDRDLLPFPPHSFDTLIYGDVLEHLKFPWINVRDHRALLRAGGRAFCSMPNVGHRRALLNLLHQRWDYEAEGLLDYTHLRFFTRTSLEAMFRGAGYATVTSDSLYPPSWKTRLFDLLTLGRLHDLNVSSLWIEARV